MSSLIRIGARLSHRAVMQNFSISGEKQVEQTTQPSNDYTARLKEEAGVLLEFLNLLEKAKTGLKFQFRSGVGQLSACKVETPLLVSKPKVHMGGTAWVGLEISGQRIRTETIECRNRLMAWVKETIQLLNRQVGSEGQFFKHLFVPVEVCFVSVMHLSGWTDTPAA